MTGIIWELTSLERSTERSIPEKSITMVTYEGFKRLGFGDSVSDELFTELVNVLGQSKRKHIAIKKSNIKSFVR